MISDTAMGPYPPRVRGGSSMLSRGAPLAARGLYEPQPISTQWMGVGSHRAGRYRPGGPLLLSPGCWNCKCMKGFMIRGWEYIFPGFGETSALTRGATLAVRWLQEPQQFSGQPIAVEFQHCAGRCRPGGSLFSPPGCWICRCMEDFLLRGWDPILLGAAAHRRCRQG